ncbi:MAG: hypothetical protein PHC86_00730 [Eubacteriales bacterium]|nr:hypothetical protein [Eubacteriales bacterium]
MKNAWLLALTIIRGSSFFSFGSDAQHEKSKWRKIGSTFLVVLLFGYLAGISGASAFALFSILSPLGLAALIPGLYISSGIMITFIFGLMYALSVFYYSSDVDRILPLPLKPETVIIAKLIVTVSYIYLFTASFILPPLLVYGVLNHTGWLYFPTLITTYLIMPVIPLAIAVFLIMIVMRFAPLTRNKDRFKAISGTILLILSLAFSYTVSNLGSLPKADLALLFAQRADQIATLTASAFPGAVLAVQIMTTSDPLDAFMRLLSLIGLSTLAIWLLLKFGKALYFKGVIGLSTAVSRRKALSKTALGQQLGGFTAVKDLHQATGKHNQLAAFWTYALKDWRVLYRTPIFMINNVAMNFLWPLFLGLPLLSAGSSDPDLQQLNQFINRLVIDGDIQAAPILLAVVFGLAIFVNGTNGIASSALSREGSQFYIMKILPMSYTRQIAAKLVVGILLGLSGLTLSFVMIYYFIPLPIWFMGLCLLTFPGALLLPNLAGIIFELYWPKLHWDNEQKAVKQNMNVVYVILGSMVVAGILIAAVAILKLNLLSTIAVIVVVPLLLTSGLLMVARRLIPRKMREIPG